MSQYRPYDDYVRRGDTFFVTLNLDASILTGVDTQTLGRIMQGHNLSLLSYDDSQWGYVLGGQVTAEVFALTDFAHVADVADAVAQSFGEAGYSPGFVSSWNQVARRNVVVPDSVTPNDTAWEDPYLRKLGPVVPPTTITDTAAQLPGLAKRTIELAVDDAKKQLEPSIPWLALAAVVVLVLVLRR